MLCAPADSAAADPNPDVTAKQHLELVHSLDDLPAGIVGWVDGRFAAVSLATAHPRVSGRGLSHLAPGSLRK